MPTNYQHLLTLLIILLLFFNLVKEKIQVMWTGIGVIVQCVGRFVLHAAIWGLIPDGPRGSSGTAMNNSYWQSQEKTLSTGRSRLQTTATSTTTKSSILALLNNSLNELMSLEKGSRNHKSFKGKRMKHK